MTSRARKRPVACDERRVKSFRTSHVHGVVRGDVLAQLPRARQEFDTPVTMEIEVGEIRDCLDAGCPESLPGGQAWRMELVAVSKETGLDSSAKWGLQEKLEKRRGVDHDHAFSRSSRMTICRADFELPVQRVRHI